MLGRAFLYALGINYNKIEIQTVKNSICFTYFPVSFQSEKNVNFVVMIPLTPLFRYLNVVPAIAMLKLCYYTPKTKV